MGGVRLNPVSERGGTHIDVAVIAFRFVTETAPGKIHGRLPGYHVSHSSRRGPGPTLIADFARIVEVIQRYEVPRQGVFVRSTAAAKLGQVRGGDPRARSSEPERRHGEADGRCLRCKTVEVDLHGNAIYLALSTQLPLNCKSAGLRVPKERHNGAYWARITKGLDFSKEDLIDAETYNWCILRKGIMGNKLCLGDRIGFKPSKSGGEGSGRLTLKRPEPQYLGGRLKYNSGPRSRRFALGERRPFHSPITQRAAGADVKMKTHIRMRP